MKLFDRVGQDITAAMKAKDQARLAPLFFYYDSAKARRELGWQPRPWTETVADTYRYWMAQDSKRRAA